MEEKIEEFLKCFGERLSGLNEEAFRTQVTALIKLKECEDAHLGEEVDRNWFEVVTQQYVFDRLNKEVRFTKHTDLQHKCYQTFVGSASAYLGQFVNMHALI